MNVVPIESENIIQLKDRSKEGYAYLHSQAAKFLGKDEFEVINYNLTFDGFYLIDKNLHPRFDSDIKPISPAFKKIVNERSSEDQFFWKETEEYRTSEFEGVLFYTGSFLNNTHNGVWFVFKRPQYELNRLNGPIPCYLAIDPGTTHTAWVELSDVVESFGWMENGEFFTQLRSCWGNYDKVGVEMIASYGMNVGREVFETCKAIGRIEEIAHHKGITCHMIYRKDVKMHLCQSMRAKDANIRQALLDLWGGKEKAIGNKKNPGPLYGLKSHTWAALAIAVYMRDTMASDT